MGVVSFLRGVISLFFLFSFPVMSTQGTWKEGGSPASLQAASSSEYTSDFSPPSTPAYHRQRYRRPSASLYWELHPDHRHGYVPEECDIGCDPELFPVHRLSEPTRPPSTAFAQPCGKRRFPPRLRTFDDAWSDTGFRRTTPYSNIPRSPSRPPRDYSFLRSDLPEFSPEMTDLSPPRASVVSSVIVTSNGRVSGTRTW